MIGDRTLFFYLRGIEENYNKKEEDFNEKGELNQLITRLIENCRRQMRVPRVYGSASDVYTWQNNYLNNS